MIHFKKKLATYYITPTNCLSFLFLLFGILSMGFKYNIYPNDIPKGLPAISKGNYRVIEHDAKKTCWTVYDANKIRIKGDNIFIPPPLIIYLSCGKEWIKEKVTNRVVENCFQKELVTIIDPHKPMATKDKVRTISTISESQAISIVKNNLNAKTKHIWSIEAHKYKDGILICGYNPVLPKGIATWWCKDDTVYNINGVAKSNTKKLENTFDIDPIQSYAKCLK